MSEARVFVHASPGWRARAVGGRARALRDAGGRRACRGRLARCVRRVCARQVARGSARSAAAELAGEMRLRGRRPYQKSGFFLTKRGLVFGVGK